MRSDDITAITRGVTRKWAKQRKAEERSARACQRREYMYSDRVCHTDVAHKILPTAYAHVSGPRGLHASQRQLYYSCREKFEELTGRPLDFKYFCNKILRAYLQRSDTATWKVSRDARGTLIEPHTDKRIGLGTLQVNEYLSKSADRCLPDPQLENDSDLPTHGPRNRYQAILYIEKEGWNELCAQVKLGERFDIAIKSCKGQSVIAARKLVDRFCGPGGIPLLVLHDFDKFGFSIFQCLSSVSHAAQSSGMAAYEFENKINAADLGLRLEDVTKWKLAPESCDFTGGFDKADTNITAAEKAYLRAGQRVELNAFTSEQFVEFVEGKLRAAGIVEKLIPDDETLEAAYRRALLIAKTNALIEREREQLEDEANDTELPSGLREKLHDALSRDPEQPWDEALYEIAKEESDAE